LDLRPKDLDLDLDLTISESEDLDLDLDLEEENLDLPPWDLTTSLVTLLSVEIETYRHNSGVYPMFSEARISMVQLPTTCDAPSSGDSRWRPQFGLG